MNLEDLAVEFPRGDVHWRAQTLTRNKDKALALAYLDARDVMDRLDDVCGPNNWQDDYTETVKGRVICRIGIFVDDRWVWKSDGAGDTAVEGEKGGISDAFKRAAVKWGIGRYLYRMDAVWCPCEVGNNSKWRKWTDDPWNHVRGGNRAPSKPKQPEQPKEPDLSKDQATRDYLRSGLQKQTTADALENVWNHADFVKKFDALPEPMRNEVKAVYTDKRTKLGGQAN